MTQKLDFKGGSGSTIKEEFDNRKYYKEQARIKNVELFDTHYQNCHYGLLNEDYEPVCLNTDNNLANLGKFSNNEAGIYAANFVTRAFEDFRRYYVATTLEKRLEFPPVIGQPTPVRAFSNFDSVWSIYIQRQIQDYAQLLISELNDIDDHKEILFRLIKDNVEEFPITKSGFLLSNKCQLSVSGLTIELAQLPYDIDAEKSQLFNSFEYSCFAELVSEMGFYIDKNAPWRLIANLDSPLIRNKILEYAPNTTPENILNRVYRKKTHFEDISAVYYFYARTLTTALETLDITFEPTYTEQFLIEETLKIRMIETGIDMSKYESMRNQVLDIHRNYSGNYPANPLKPAAAKIGKFCSEKIKEIYLAKSKINSYNKTTLKDIM